MCCCFFFFFSSHNDQGWLLVFSAISKLRLLCKFNDPEISANKSFVLIPTWAWERETTRMGLDPPGRSSSQIMTNHPVVMEAKLWEWETVFGTLAILLLLMTHNIANSKTSWRIDHVLRRSRSELDPELHTEKRARFKSVPSSYVFGLNQDQTPKSEASSFSTQEHGWNKTLIVSSLRLWFLISSITRLWGSGHDLWWFAMAPILAESSTSTSWPPISSWASSLSTRQEEQKVNKSADECIICERRSR